MHKVKQRLIGRRFRVFFPTSLAPLFRHKCPRFKALLLCDGRPHVVGDRQLGDAYLRFFARPIHLIQPRVLPVLATIGTVPGEPGQERERLVGGGGQERDSLGGGAVVRRSERLQRQDGGGVRRAAFRLADLQVCV